MVFTIHEQQAVLPHYFYYPIAPNKMSALPLTRERAREHLGIQNAEQTIAILIGADTKTVKLVKRHNGQLFYSRFESNILQRDCY